MSLAGQKLHLFQRMLHINIHDVLVLKKFQHEILSSVVAHFNKLFKKDPEIVKGPEAFLTLCNAPVSFGSYLVKQWLQLF